MTAELAPQAVELPPPPVRMYFALRVAVRSRDADATRQALRTVAEMFSDAQAHFIVSTLACSLDAKGRGWLAGLR